MTLKDLFEFLINFDLTEIPKLLLELIKLIVIELGPPVIYMGVILFVGVILVQCLKFIFKAYDRVEKKREQKKIDQKRDKYKNYQ